jgi:uncharacterized protein (DUF1330 family)
MPGYILAKVTVTDAKTFQEYLQANPATVTKYGGKYIVRGGEKETLEGAPVDERIVIIEFPSYDKAKELKTAIFAKHGQKKTNTRLWEKALTVDGFAAFAVLRNQKN